MANWDSEIRDSWKIRSLPIPTVAFGEHRKGEGFKQGYILPITEALHHNPTFVGKGYFEMAQMEPDFLLGPNGKRDVPNPKAGQPRRWEKGYTKGAIMQDTVVMLLIPEWAGKELNFDTHVSEKYEERMKAALGDADGAEETGDFLTVVQRTGLRQLWVTGGSLAPNFRTAMRANGGRPTPGMSIGVWINAILTDDEGRKPKEYAVTAEPPTPEGLEAVRLFMEKELPKIAPYLLAGREATQEAGGEEAVAKATADSREDSDDGGLPPF